MQGGRFDYDSKKEKQQEIALELATDSLWSKPELAASLNKQKNSLDKQLQLLESTDSLIKESQEFLELVKQEINQQAKLEDLQDLLANLGTDMQQITASVDEIEFRSLFSDELDSLDCFLEIQSGSGGTEAQDWAEMLLRMYTKWSSEQEYSCELLEISDGDVAGIKSATLKIQGDHAYGWLKLETGVHRLVRKSPFDSNNKRHTSFASVFISPIVSKEIEVAINPAELRIDTYRASGAGGQHVNKTDSAVRITHLPSNIVVQCQSQRSQHQNKAMAMEQLKAKLYELEKQKEEQEMAALEEQKTDIGWGNQIRSYVLDQSRIKDLRSGHEVGDCQAVLNGHIQDFLKASLQSRNNA